MRAIAAVISLLFIISTASAATTYIWLDPSDPHWVKKEDPANVLIDGGDYWKSAAGGKVQRPSIYFDLPEVAEHEGKLTFRWKKDIPNSFGWDAFYLYASKDGKTWVKLWENPQKWKYYEGEETVLIPPGYVHLKFYFVDGDMWFETITLWKQMKLVVEEVPPTVTPTQPAAQYDYAPLLALALIAVIALIVWKKGVV